MNEKELWMTFSGGKFSAWIRHWRRSLGTPCDHSFSTHSMVRLPRMQPQSGALQLTSECCKFALPVHMKFLFLSMMIASAPLAFCEPVTVDGTDVTFEPPQGFTRLSEERIALKFPNKGAPRFVFGNKAGTTTVAYDLRPKEIPQEKLGDVEKLYTQLLEKGIPGIEWKNKGIIELAGQKWVLFEMTSSAADTDIHNIMLMTGYKGQALLFNFNSTKQEFPLVEKALRESIASIKIPAETAPRK